MKTRKRWAIMPTAFVFGDGYVTKLSDLVGFFEYFGDIHLRYANICDK